jgi:hypothetical protein
LNNFVKNNESSNFENYIFILNDRFISWKKKQKKIVLVKRIINSCKHNFQLVCAYNYLQGSCLIELDGFKI